MVKFSFIIPHRNLPASYLQRCLDSIPHREDVQIIVIDDHSDPEIVDFEHFPGLDDPCTEVIFSKKGLGPGVARNLGVEQARGEWLLFVDADDYCDREGLLCLMDRSSEVSADVIYWGIKVHKNTGEEIFWDYYPQGIYEDRCYPTADKHALFLLLAPWGKMVRKQLVVEHNLQFEEGRGSEDLLFSIRLALAAQSVCFFPRRLYVYEVREGSLETTIDRDMIMRKIEISVRAGLLLKQHGLLRYRDQIHLYLYRLKTLSRTCYYKALLRELRCFGFLQTYKVWVSLSRLDKHSWVSCLDRMRVKLALRSRFKR